MTYKVRGYAARSAAGSLGPFSFSRRSLRPQDVKIEILYCGVCHSDLHMARNDWGNAAYPMVPGHEIIGRVVELGRDANKFGIGDHVGVGCMVDSCRQCVACARGMQQYCETGATFTYNSPEPEAGATTYGGYSETIGVHEDFVLKIPATLDLKAAAPLLCAGITTWSPLRHWKVGPDSKVAIVGLGGLGHMAIKLARGLRAHVTLMTRSPEKKKDALRLGAHEVVLSTEPQQIAAAHGRFDLILDTVPYAHDINQYIPALAAQGTLVLIGYMGPLEPALHSFPLVVSRRSVAGSFIGGVPETQEMLDFCGQHGITADVEVIAIDDINAAFDRMLKGDVTYRFVVDMESLKRSD